MDKKQSRLRRSRKTRAKIAELKVVRLLVHRTNCHIYAQIIDASGGKVLASASTRRSQRCARICQKAATRMRPLWLASALLKRQKSLALKPLLLTVQASNIMVVLKRWLKLRVKTV